jgi:hypothetical protein
LPPFSIRYSRKKRKGADLRPAPSRLNPQDLLIQLVALLEPLHSSGGINHFSFAGEEGMALAAQLDVKSFPGGAGGEDIAARASHLGIRIIFGMNFFFHFIYCSA